MANGHGIFGRLRKLEESVPDPDENAAFIARLARARARVEASMTDEERAYRETPEYALEVARRRAIWDTVVHKNRKK